MSRHPGELAVQRRMGVTREDWGSAGVGPQIPEVAADFLAQQRIVVIGAADDEGAMWADAITGPAGFATVKDERTLVVVGRPGHLDPLFETGPREVGMLAIEPATRRRMRVNGTAEREGETLVVRTEQVYSNCPKYIQTREVLDDTLADAAGATLTTDSLNADQQAWIGGADTFFMATRAPGQGADVSHRGGNPGFVRALGPSRLVWPDYVGNSMYMTLGNLELDPSSGLLFLDWENGHALHLTGRARVDWDPSRAVKQMVEFDVDRVVEAPGALRQRWAFGSFHPRNPKVPPGGDSINP